MDTTSKPASTKKNIAALVGVVSFAVIYFAVQYFMKPSIDKQMMSAASEINKTCPVMVDNETRLDNTVALYGKIFQYNYTLVKRDRSEIDTNVIKKGLEPNVINNIKTNPDMKSFRDSKLTMVYYYKDKSGAYLMQLVVTPDMYENK